MMGLMTKREHQRKMDQLHDLYQDDYRILHGRWVDAVLSWTPEGLRQKQHDIRKARR